MRDTSTEQVGSSGIRTVELHTQFGEHTKWAATLGDLRAFGKALIDLADGK